jgi:hypothetical protein
MPLLPEAEAEAEAEAELDTGASVGVGVGVEVGVAVVGVGVDVGVGVGVLVGVAVVGADVVDCVLDELVVELVLVLVPLPPGQNVTSKPVPSGHVCVLVSSLGYW